MKLRPETPTITDVEILHYHMFCGLGGGAKGMNRGDARVGALRARFTCIGGVDSDPAAIADFSRAAGVSGTVIDLFSHDQYVAFWGKEPPPGWQEATATDIQVSAGGRRPNIVFLSAPCKGFSGLLAETISKTAKYQALNGLTLRGIFLMLEAWKDDPPELIVFENVPRIARRGRGLLDQIIGLLRAYGYAVAETTHDCGELGGLGQSRKRFLLVARHVEKVPPFLYEPVKRPLKGVGEIIGRFPVPGPDLILPMHRMPALQWQTWVRLAFVEAGADWRSLNRLAVKDGYLADFGIAPDYGHNGVLGVNRWDQPTGVLGGRTGPTTGKHAVADPRSPSATDRGAYGVVSMDDHAHTVTSQRAPGQGTFSVADPRSEGDRAGPFGVTPWKGKASGTIAGESMPTNGSFAVADPRVANGHPKSVQLGVRRMSDVGATVKGDVSVGTGPYTIADPRPVRPVFNNIFRIVPFDGPAPAVAEPGGSGGGLGVADPRPGYGPSTHQNVLQVHRMTDTAKTIASGTHPAGGALSVADPRPSDRADYQQVKYRVTREDEAAGAVIAASTTGNGAFAVADTRPGGLKGKGDHYASGGHYGVVPWRDHTNAVSASAMHDNGFNSVADPRDGDGAVVTEFRLPKPKDRLVCCIRALDGTWHRPFTTLELAALQGLVDPEETLLLEGLSDSAWRERIGNAVPPPAAQAIASVMGQTLLAAWSGQTFMLGSTDIWVRQIAVGLSVKDAA